MSNSIFIAQLNAYRHRDSFAPWRSKMVCVYVHAITGHGTPCPYGSHTGDPWRQFPIGSG